VTIPLFGIRDANGDGRGTSSRDEGRFGVYLARPDGRFPKAPSCDVDLALIRAQLRAGELDDIDLSNLTSLSKSTQVISKDVNGDGAEDLVLPRGKCPSSGAGPRDRPGSPIKSSNRRNVFFASLLDEDSDRAGPLAQAVEAISRETCSWLIASGTVDFRDLHLPETSGRFAAVPRGCVTLRASIVSSSSRGEDLGRDEGQGRPPRGGGHRRPEGGRTWRSWTARGSGLPRRASKASGRPGKRKPPGVLEKCSYCRERMSTWWT
jgi:hypothetical protein